MSLYMRALLPHTYRGLELIANEREWPAIYGYMEPEQVAWMCYRLEFCGDNEDYFPAGKWATIQRLQDMLREFAKSQSGQP